MANGDLQQTGRKLNQERATARVASQADSAPSSVPEGQVGGTAPVTPRGGTDTVASTTSRDQRDQLSRDRTSSRVQSQKTETPPAKESKKAKKKAAAKQKVKKAAAEGEQSLTDLAYIRALDWAWVTMVGWLDVVTFMGAILAAIGTSFYIWYMWKYYIGDGNKFMSGQKLPEPATRHKVAFMMGFSLMMVWILVGLTLFFVLTLAIQCNVFSPATASISFLTEDVCRDIFGDLFF